VNATIGSPTYVDSQESTISSPSTGDVVKFIFRGPSGSVAKVFNVCGSNADFTLSSCDIPINQPLLTTGASSPIRVDYAYPT
jgi:hypothetical protein